MDLHSNLMELFISILNLREVIQPKHFLEYELVLVSCKTKTWIYGAQTESKFRSCSQDLETSTLDYVTKDSHKVTI